MEYFISCTPPRLEDMNRALKLSAWVGGRTLQRNCPRRQQFSTAATASAGDGSLPLEGYRVLDMTRVLAGVSFFDPYQKTSLIKSD